jgi:hypothetical protein
MTDTGEAPRIAPPGQSDQQDFLAPLITTLSSYRRPLRIGLAVCLAAFVAVAIILRLTLPSEQFGMISFRIEMEGAASGEYPNGTKFSPEEIVATPILMRVYEINDVKRYSDFAPFASAFLIENSSPQRDALIREYQAKLSDTRLTPVDRGGLEAEFQDRLNALNTPEFRLRFRQFSSAQQIPSVLVNKILQDTLRAWAQFAGERKGALSYNIPFMGRGVLSWEQIARKESLTGLDILRLHTMKVLDTLDNVRSTLPGADAIRVGEKRITMEEIRTMLENLLRFSIEPLSNAIVSRGSANPVAVRAYIESQVQQGRLERDEVNHRVAGLEQSLQQYSEQFTGATGTGASRAPSSSLSRGQANSETLMFGESLLDRLMQMSSRKEEVVYRQRLIDRLITERFLAAKLEREVAYYEGLSGVRGASNILSRTAIEQEMKAAYDELSSALDHVITLHNQLVQHNLNPSTVLYTVTLPYTLESFAPFTVRQAFLWGLAFMIVMFFVIVLTEMIYDRVRPLRLATRTDSRGSS